MKTIFTNFILLFMSIFTFISCSTDDELKTQQRVLQTQAAPSTPSLTIKNNIDATLRFDLFAYGDKNQTGVSENILLSQYQKCTAFQTYELINFRSTFVTGLSDSNQFWNVTENNTNSVVQYIDANFNYGSFVNGINNNDGYAANWHLMKGVVDGVFDHQITGLTDFEIPFIVVINSLTGEPLGFAQPVEGVFNNAFIQIQADFLNSGSNNLVEFSNLTISY